MKPILIFFFAGFSFSALGQQLPICQDGGLVPTGGRVGVIDTTASPVALNTSTFGVANWKQWKVKPSSITSIYETDTKIGGAFSSLVQIDSLKTLSKSDRVAISKVLAFQNNQPNFKPWELDLDGKGKSASLTNILANTKSQKIPLHPFAMEALESPDIFALSYGQLRDLEDWTTPKSFVRSGAVGPVASPGNVVAKMRGKIREQGMVVGGGETQPGGLSGLAPNQFPVLGKGPSGETCLRKAVDSDFLPGKNGEMKVQYDPLAFLEVGKIVARSTVKDVSGVATDVRHHVCTVIAIADSFALTAAHCVLDQANNSSGYVVRTSLKNADRALVLFPKPGHARETGTDCLGMTGPCNYHRAVITSIHIPDEQRWEKSAATPRHDVAVVALSYLENRPPVRVQLAKSPPANADISIAGFGKNNVSGQYYSGVQYAGWQRVRFVEPGVFGWMGDSLSASPRVTNVCSGDSGGPVYSGIVNNQTEDFRPQVSGVLSYIDATSTPTEMPIEDRCIEAKGYAVSIDPHYRSFICSRIGKGTFCGN